jgi:hypothetical protein
MKTQAQGVLVGNYKQCITNKRHASTNTKTNTLQQPNPAPQQEQTAGKKKNYSPAPPQQKLENNNYQLAT